MKARLAALAIVSSLVVMAGCTRNEDASRDVTRQQTTDSAMNTPSQPTDQQPGTVASPAPTLPQDQPGAFDQPGSATDSSGSMGTDTPSDAGSAGSGTESTGSSSY